MMRKELEAKLQAELQDAVVCVKKTDERTIFVDVKRESIRKASQIVTEMNGRYLCSVGYDNIARDGSLGMVHTYAVDSVDRFICVRTSAPESDPVMESITPDLPSAGWSEREFMDLLGMQFTNHPKPKKLVPVSYTHLALMVGKAQHYWHQNNLMRKTLIPRREYDQTLLLLSLIHI